MQAAYRITKNRQFQYVYRKGKGVSMPHLSLVYVRAGKQQVGFSVSKKIGNAVLRNRVKRRLRECFRLQMQLLRPGFYVFTARMGAAQMDSQTLLREMNGLLARLHLYREG